MAVLDGDAPFHARSLYVIAATIQIIIRDRRNMNSAERHEKRYQRRKAARAAAKAARAKHSDSYDKVFSYGNLYRAYRQCRRNVSWKSSVQKYITQAPINVYRTWEQLQKGTYRSPAFFEFDIFERGKKRHIRSVNIGERIVQKCLCDNALIPRIAGSFIYDNGASRKKKGYDFAVNRMLCHLQRHIRKSGTGGYILLGDFKAFFDEIMHWVVDQILRKRFSDLRLIGITEDLIRMFDPDKPFKQRRGLGLGSPISQVLAPAVASAIDHFVKNVLHIKGYGRYMDDFYLVHESKLYLQHCANVIRKRCREIGMTLSERKTQIVKLTHGFTWLKVRVFITKTGKIIRKLHRSSVVRQRRKLKKLYGLFVKGIITLRDAWNSFQSWRSHARRFRAYHAINKMEALFARLFVGSGKTTLAAA